MTDIVLVAGPHDPRRWRYSVDRTFTALVLLVAVVVAILVLAGVLPAELVLGD